MAKKEKVPFKKRCKNISTEFKKFISRGNVVDMAVGVIIGGAFSTIVKTFTNILLSLATWGVPGGLTGLITVLPAANSSQMPKDGLKAIYTSEEWSLLTLTAEQKATYVHHGDIWYFKQCAVIDWGAFINAIITFFIIALTLFMVVKIFKGLQTRRKRIADRLQEEYYEKHPEERPEVKPVVKPITELDVLKDMNELMHKQASYPVRAKAGANSHYKK